MKKKVLFAAMLSATLLGATQAVKAHPGRTDGNAASTVGILRAARPRPDRRPRLRSGFAAAKGIVARI